MFNVFRRLSKLVRNLRTIVSDCLSFFANIGRRRLALAAENLFLRKQLLYSGDHGQSEFSRIDSPKVLPVRGRCLMKILPVNHGVADEAAIERGDTTRVSQSNPEAIRKYSVCGKHRLRALVLTVTTNVTPDLTARVTCRVTRRARA